MTARGFIDQFSDPILGLDGTQIRLLNEAAREEFDVTADLEGESVSALFATDETLATRYEDELVHFTDVGGVIDGGTRHFDADHPTIAALLDGRQSVPDPDVGLFKDGQLQYYHLSSSPVEDEGITQLVTFRDVTRLKGRERDLDFLMQVLSRILRHNIRNELTVAQGYTSTIADRTDEPVPDYAAQVLHTCDKILDTTEKARRIQKAISADERIPFHLPRVVDDVLASVEQDVDEITDDLSATVDVDVPDVTALANPMLADAIEEAVENSIEHSDGEATVKVTAEREGPWTDVRVIDDGPGIPEKELETLDQRGETSLVHGSGAGLWLVYTIVQESGGNVVFDSDDAGTTVRMRLPVADGTYR